MPVRDEVFWLFCEQKKPENSVPIWSPYNAVVELVNPAADAVSRKTYTGAAVDWYVKAEDIVLKNKSNQNAGNPQNHATQGQPKK